MNKAQFYLQTLGVLSQDGIIRFISIHTCKLLFDVGGVENRINNAAVSPGGRYLVAVMEDGSLHVYNLHTMSEELSKARNLHYYIVYYTLLN